MPFLLKSRRTSVEKLLVEYAGAVVVDVTSRGPEPWVRFSPFYPHGGIPVPFSPGVTAMSVEGIWQGLKVFENADVDPATFQIATMKGIKRTVRTCGNVLDHRAGLAGERLLPYGQARREIYIPTYRWVLEAQRVQAEALRERPEGVVDVEADSTALPWPTSTRVGTAGTGSSRRSSVVPRREVGSQHAHGGPPSGRCAARVSSPGDDRS